MSAKAPRPVPTNQRRPDPPPAPPPKRDSEIRYLGDVQRLELKLGDKLVIHADRHLSLDEIKHIEASVKAMFGHSHPVIVMDKGLRLSVLSETLPDGGDA